MAAAQSTLTPQQQLEQAQKQLEQAQKALEEAQKKAAQAQIQQAEQLKKQAEEISKQAKQLEQQKAQQTEQQKVQQPQGSVQDESQQQKSASLQTAQPTQEKKNTWVVPTDVPAKKTEAKTEKKTLANGATLKCDSKYLEGAVTLNEEGKIVFSMTTDANGKSAAEIYALVYPYMQELTQGKDQVGSRMALVNPEEHIIANAMDEWLVFNSSFISLDRTEVRYNLIATIKDNYLQVELSRINYAYEVDRPTGFRLPAEEVINDKVALTKKKNNLAKIYGKFRRLTIDRKDAIFSGFTALVKK